MSVEASVGVTAVLGPVYVIPLLLLTERRKEPGDR